MTLYKRGLTLAALLAACAPNENNTADSTTESAAASVDTTQQPAAPTTSAATFRAVGNEPGWLLTVEDTTLTLQWDYNERRLSVKVPEAQSVSNGREYRFTHADTSYVIRVQDTPCADVMSGHRFPSTVTVNIGTRVLNGCGGEPGTLLQGDQWVVESIEGRKVDASITITMQFGTDGRISGKVCNRYSGNYSTRGNDLSTSQIISTKMACTPEIDRYETQLLSILGAPTRFYIEGETLTIERDRTPVVTARKN